MLTKLWKNIIIKLFNDMNQIMLGDTKLCIKISIKDLLQGMGWIFAFIHQIHTSHEGAQHNIRRSVICHVLRKRLKISRHERIQVGIQQSVIKIKQQC